MAVNRSTAIQRSADRSVLLFARIGNVANNLLTYSAHTDSFTTTSLTRIQSYQSPEAICRDGKMVAVLGNLLSGEGFADSQAIGLPSPAGYVFSPTQNILFLIDIQYDVIVDFDTVSLETIGKFPVGEDLFSYIEMTISADGTLVFVKTPQGIRGVPIASSPSPTMSSSGLDGESILTSIAHDLFFNQTFMVVLPPAVLTIGILEQRSDSIDHAVSLEFQPTSIASFGHQG